MTFVAPTSARSAHAARAARELGLVALTMIGYFGLRLVVEGDRGTAVRNADRLLALEGRLGIDVERDAQRWVLEHGSIRDVLSAGYVWLHWPLLIAVMVVLALQAPDVLARLRVAMAASAAIGIVLFATVPMAPPRFMPGFVGTVSDAARRHYLPYSLEWTNQVAAFPSYHVGWTLIACLAFARLLSARAGRLAVMAPALVVAVAVIGTGNHYVLDSVAGATFALGAWWIAGRWESDRTSVAAGDERERAHVEVDQRRRSVTPGSPAAPA